MNNGFKKAICMIVAAVTMFACAACGGDKPTGGDIGNGGDEPVAVSCLKDRKYERVQSARTQQPDRRGRGQSD